MLQSVGNPSPYADSPDTGRIMSRTVDQLSGSKPSAALTAAYAFKRGLGAPKSSSSLKAAFSQTQTYSSLLPAGKKLSGEPGNPFAPPRQSDALQVREEQKGAGIYGIGIKIDVTPPFKVQRVVNLQSVSGESINDSVTVGDRLVFVDGHAIDQAEYLNFVERLIFGEQNTTVTLTFKRKDEESSYKVVANRHVPIKTWEGSMKWAELQSGLEGKELVAEPGIVQTMESIRMALHDRSGTAIDLLKEEVHEPCSLGFRLALESSSSALRSKQIDTITPGGPAFMGGDLMVGDEIVSVDGVAATDSNVIKLLQGSNAVGSKCFVSVKRQARTFDVRLIRMAAAQLRQVELLMSSIDALQKKVAESGNAEALKLVEHVQALACHVESERCQREINLAERAAGLHNQIIDALNRAEMMLHPAGDGETQLSNLMHRIEELRAQLAAATAARVESEKKVIDLTHHNSDLQDRLRESQDQLASLRASVAGMVPRAVHDSIQGSLAAVTAEKKVLEDNCQKHVAAVQLESANEELAALRAQLERVRNGAGGSVPSEQVEALTEELRRTRQERDALRAAASGSVDRGEFDKASKEAEERRAEVHALRMELLRKIDKDELAAAQGEVDRKLSELERLRKALEGMVTESELTEERGETQKLARMVQDLRAQNQRLEDQLVETRLRGGSLVPGSELLAAQAQVSAMQLKVEDAEAGRKTLEVYGAAQRERIGRLLADLEAAEQRAAQLEERGAGASQSAMAERAAALAAAEERLAESLAQVERLKREREELKAELERRRADMDAMVPRAELLAARREAAAGKEEAAVERAEAGVQAEQRQSATERVAGLKHDLEVLRAAQAEMAPRAELVAAMTEGREQRDKAEGNARTVALLEQERAALRAELEKVSGEVAQLRLADVGKVERSVLDEAKEDGRKARERADASEQQTKVTKEELDRASDDVLELRKQVEDLRRQLSQRVPRGELLVAEAEGRARGEEVAGLKEEAALLQEQNKTLHGQVLALREELEAAREAQTDKVPRTDLLASKDKEQAAVDRADGLQGELDAVKGKLEEATDALSAATAELDTLRQQASGSVPRQTHLEVLHEARGSQEAAGEWEAKAVSAERVATEVREAVTSVREEAERLRTEVADTVPRGRLVAVESHVEMLQQDLSDAERRRAELTEQLSSLRGTLHDRNAEVDALKAKVAAMVPSADLLQAQADAKTATVKADALESEVGSMVDLLDGCKERLGRMVAVEELAAAEAKSAQTLRELQALQLQLAEAGLAHPSVLRRLTDALRGPTPCDPALVAELLEAARGPPWTELEELTGLVRTMATSPAVSAGEVLLLLRAVQRPVLETTQVLRVADETPKLSPGELSRLRSLVVQGERGAGEERALEEVEEMLQLVPSLRELRALLEERAVTQGRVRVMEAEARQREALVADLRLRVCPQPREHEEVAALLADKADLERRLFAALSPAPPLMEPEGRAFADTIKVKVRAATKGMRVLCTTDESAPSESNYRAGGASPLLLELRSTETLRAICVDREGRSSEVAAERYVCETSRDGLAGIGLLLERMAESDSTQVKSVKPGGAAGIDGRVKANDFLLKIDGRDVKGLSLSTMVKLTQGRQGTQISLLLSRHPENFTPDDNSPTEADTDVYAVTLTRVLAADTKVRTGALAASVALGMLRGRGAETVTVSSPPPHPPSVMADGMI